MDPNKASLLFCDVKPSSDWVLNLNLDVKHNFWVMFDIQLSDFVFLMTDKFHSSAPKKSQCPSKLVTTITCKILPSWHCDQRLVINWRSPDSSFKKYHTKRYPQPYWSHKLVTIMTCKNLPSWHCNQRLVMNWRPSGSSLSHCQSLEVILNGESQPGTVFLID